MNRVLVTPRSLTAGGHPALRPLTEGGFELVMPNAGASPDEAELIRLLPGCVGYLAGVEPINEAVLRTADRLQVISRNGVGVDNIDLEAARRHGVAVEVAPGANSGGVAELTLGLTLAALRDIAANDRVMKAGGWQRRIGGELASSTVGIVGLGAIGTAVAAMFRSLGARVVGHDIAVYASAGIDVKPLASVLEEAKILTLHCPPKADGTPLLGAAEIARLPAGAVIVNTARASLVDNAAVLAALDDGHLRAYATDVYEHEPPMEEPLLRHTKVLCTPHVGGFTVESVDRATTAAVANLLKHLEPMA